MNRKRTFIILGIIVLLFLGIFTFAQGNNEEEPKKNGKDNGSGQIIDQNDENLEEVIEEIVNGRSSNKKTVSDTTAPTIILNGAEVIYLDIKSEYKEEGAIVKDNRDSDKSATISGEVDTNKVGKYTVTYSGSDSAGNSATKVIRTIYVRPLITLSSSSDIYEMGDNLPVISATVLYDTAIGEVDLISDIEFNPKALGSQTLKYSYTYEEIDAIDKSITILVQDTSAPTDLLVALKTADDGKDYNSDWTNQTVIAELSALDKGSGINKFQYSIDGGITWVDGEGLAKDTTISSFEFVADGEMAIIFRAVDNVGLTSSSSFEKIIKIDKTKPVLSMKGTSPIAVVRNGLFGFYWIDYTDEGFTYEEINVDSISTVIKYSEPYSTNEVIVGKVDTKVGTYKIYYNVTDLAGNSTTEVRIIYVIRLIDDININDIEINVGKTKFNVCTSLNCQTEFNPSDFNAIARDWWNGKWFAASSIMDITVETTLNLRVLGKYSATFTATDWRGRTYSRTVSINVVDEVDPVLIQSGMKTVNLQGKNIEIPKYIAEDNYDTNVDVIENYDYRYSQYKVEDGQICILFICGPKYKKYTDIYVTVKYSAKDKSGNSAKGVSSEEIFVTTVDGWKFF